LFKRLAIRLWPVVSGRNGAQLAHGTSATPATLFAMADRIVLAAARDKARATLEGLIANGEQVHSSADEVRDDQSFEDWKRAQKRWRAYARTALQTISVDDALAQEFDNATFSLTIGGPRTLPEKLRDWLADHIRELEDLRSMVDRLELFEVAPGAAEQETSTAKGASLSTQVFLVHGRQRDSADVVARFVTKLGLNP